MQICILLETHWGFDSEWMMRSYHALHGGLNRKHAGILVLIHKTFIASQGIRSASIVPGRLLQIRLDTEPAITIFAVYQTVWADGSKQETSLTHRELLWSKLDSAIKGVSKRSQLLIAGDLNTPCLSHPPNVGPSVLATPANVKQKDQQRLQQLLLQHNLIALNTWGRRKYCHTYQFETAGSVHRTQIDFLLFRAQHSDALAKSARTIQAPFVPPTGMRHLPLLVSLPKPVAPRTGPSGGTRVTAREVASSLRQDPALSTRFQQEVQRLFSGNTAGDPAHALNQVILQAWKIVKPSPVPTRALPNPTAGLVLQLWTLRKQRNHAEFVARASFMRKWLLATRISRTQRLLKQACRAKKRARVEVLLEEAENSPRPSTVFSVIRRLAPKSKVMRVQLRDALGRLLIGEEEAAFIAKYLRKIFSSEAKSGPPDSAPITGPEFTYDELKGALECLAGNKALPSAFAPAQLWKLVPDVVVPSLLPVMNLQSDHLQSDWHKVQLCLIPKLPVVREPKSLRPISLLHPANKLLATMLADRVRPKVCQYLATVPQWAYLPGRSAADALESVCSHLFQVRSMLQENTHGVTKRFRGTLIHKLLGGISISLDVKKAFDSLSHAFLEEAMREACFDAAEISIILHLHTHACLQASSGDSTASVYLGTGVRQGCSLSPILWALATGRVYRLYRESLMAQSLPEGLINMFADDFFGSWVFKSPEVFRQAIRSIGVLVQTLQRVGLALSLDKTVILLATSGTSTASVLGPYKRIIEGETYLQIPVGQNKVLFKVVGAHKYLGAKLSYQGFEALNLRHRLATAWGSFWRLHSILIHKSLAMQTRVRLWQACVMSVLRYSIHHVGLPTNGPQLIRQAVHRQLRLIARSPAHLWHVSSADILKRLNVVDPWETLCKQFSGPSDASSQVSPVTRSLTTWHSILRVTFEATHSADSPNPQWMGAVSSHTKTAPIH